jgi:hypothetical protein
MTIVCTPDVGIPLPDNANDPEFSDALAAACETLNVLQDEGLDVTSTPDDIGIAAEIVQAFAAAEDQDRAVPTQSTISKTPTSALQLTKSLLEQYSHAVVESAVQLRHLVTNRLIIESDNADPRVRIRALELLGKISDVGLFTERSEVVITHQSSTELENKLRDKLRRLMGEEDVVDVVDIAGEALDVSKELGLQEAVDETQPTA